MIFLSKVFPESLIPQPQTGGREHQYFLPLTDFHSPIAKVLIKRTLRLEGNPSMENQLVFSSSSSLDAARIANTRTVVLNKFCQNI